jgi:hypothetical protein
MRSWPESTSTFRRAGSRTTPRETTHCCALAFGPRGRVSCSAVSPFLCTILRCLRQQRHGHGDGLSFSVGQAKERRVAGSRCHRVDELRILGGQLAQPLRHPEIGEAEHVASQRHEEGGNVPSLEMRGEAHCGRGVKVCGIRMRGGAKPIRTPICDAALTRTPVRDQLSVARRCRYRLQAACQ